MPTLARTMLYYHNTIVGDHNVMLLYTSIAFAIMSYGVLTVDVVFSIVNNIGLTPP